MFNDDDLGAALESRVADQESAAALASTALRLALTADMSAEVALDIVIQMADNVWLARRTRIREVALGLINKTLNEKVDVDGINDV